MTFEASPDSTVRSSSGTSRRQVLGCLGAALLGGPALIRNAHAADSIVFVGWGGALQKSYDAHVLQPIARKLGVQLINAYGPDLAKLKAQVLVNKVEWDFLSTTGAMAMAGGREGLFEKIDYSIVTNADALSVPKAEFALPWYVYWGGIAYDPKRHPPGKFPTTWAEFWDVKRFPGRRGLRNRPDEILEIALLADGVAPKDLYPLDVERAFRSLNKIKPHVTNWIAQTPQTISLIQTNELDFTYAYKSRVLAAQESGVSMDIVDTHPLVTNTYVCVGKGTKNKAVVMRFLNELLSPEMQAAFVNNNIGNGPITNNAGPRIKPDVAKLVPDLKSAKVALTDDQWWADNYEKVAPRFKEWLLTG